MHIISAKQAKGQALKQYFTGKPCRQGHIAPRWTSTHVCSVCTAKRAKVWRADSTNTEHRRRYRNKWMVENPESVQKSRQKIQPQLSARATKKRRANVLPYLVYQAKRRAKEKCIPFDITVEDLVLPKICPVLGITIVVGKGKQVDGSATIDRIIPSKGYVKGNVCVISAKANRVKNDASLEELQLVVDYLSLLTER